LVFFFFRHQDADFIRFDTHYPAAVFFQEELIERDRDIDILVRIAIIEDVPADASRLAKEILLYFLGFLDTIVGFNSDDVTVRNTIFSDRFRLWELNYQFIFTQFQLNFRCLV
jgi:hypothetical protein